MPRNRFVSTVTPSIVVALLFVLVGCGDGGGPTATGVEAPSGFTVEVFATGFEGPTQMLVRGDDLFVAELNGAENDSTGRILQMPLAEPSQRTVLHEGLDKPTGIAIAGDSLWVMERRQLSVATLEPNAALEAVVEEMPFNGRSQGTLTVTPDGQLLYNTSGSKRGADRVEGSGQLFAINDATQGFSEPEVIASGFKHAYAHVVDSGGQLWSVEMTDGNFDGSRAPDELVALSVGDDAGWPQCVGDNRVVTEFGGTDALCKTSPRSHALFGDGATPTSIAVAPWDPDTLLASLWVPGKVVAVPRKPDQAGPHVPTTFLDGIESPQHLLVVGDDLLVSDHATGQIFIVRRVN